ncbi:hypothetical protein J1N35_040935 [Gossypium stocksii]|uniref:Reverse transcriptase zinc-binding domain-containing protein n=1 Tax=Gossypium stocksii TaxID=47602 RepID=A0A9D3ZIU2_9ROSI|nr:hypothetical protein J1N35_040935 [Gossypium stocksii]
MLLQLSGDPNQLQNQTKYMHYMPSKLKITVWTCCRNFIPTLCNLLYRRLTNEVICPKCAVTVETCEHVFRECLVTRDTWRRLNCAWPELVEEASFIDWITWFFENNSTSQCRTFACAIWVQWTERNKWIHERQKKLG